MTATVTKLPIKRVAKVAKVAKVATSRKPSAAMLRAATMQRLQGYAYGSVAAVGVALSLSHLAEGVARVAHRAAWEGWSIALMIDAGFILTEIAPYTMTRAASDDTKRARQLFSGCVLAASAAFNALAFSGEATGAWQVAAIAIGVALPAGIAFLAHQAGRCLVGRSH